VVAFLAAGCTQPETNAWEVILSRLPETFQSAIAVAERAKPFVVPEDITGSILALRCRAISKERFLGNYFKGKSIGKTSAALFSGVAQQQQKQQPYDSRAAVEDSWEQQTHAFWVQHQMVKFTLKG
jgi:hypothetical protein